MRKSCRPLAAAIAGSALVLALSLPVVPSFLGASPAFAKNGNGGGSSNGGGNGNGNSGGHSPAASNLASTGPGQSSTAGGHFKLKKIDVASTSDADGIALAATGKNKVKGLDAQIGALHAVHANLQAFIHANPNSRVGRIAAYAISAVAVEGLTQDLADKLAELAGSETALADAATAFGESTELADFAALVPGDASLSFAELQDRFATLSTAVDPLTLDEAAELAALTTLLDSQSAADLATATQTAADLAIEAEAAQVLLDEAEQAATDALAAAANKPVTDDVKIYVDTALEDGGILDYYRAQ